MTVQQIVQPKTLFGEKEDTLFYEPEKAAAQKNLPDDDIWVVKGNGVAPVNEVNMLSVDTDTLFEDSDLAETYERIKERGISRGDIPEVRQLLGRDFPDVPDAMFTEFPSKNGMDLIQEDFFKNVITGFVKGCKYLWGLVVGCWNIVLQLGRKTCKELWAKAKAYNTYVITANMISKEIKDKLGADYPEFCSELDAVVNVDDLIKALNDLGGAIDGDIVNAEVSSDRFKHLADRISEMVPIASDLIVQFKLMVEGHAEGSHSNTINESRAMFVVELNKKLQALWAVGSGKFATAFTSVPDSPGEAAKFLLTKADEFNTNIRSNGDRQQAGWVRKFVEQRGQLTPGAMDLDSVKLETALKTAEDLMAKNKDINPKQWSDDMDFQAFRPVAERMFAYVGEWSQFCAAAVKYISTVQAAAAEYARRSALLESKYLTEQFVVLGKNKKWLIINKWGLERFQRDLKKMGIYQDIMDIKKGGKEYIKVDKDGNVSFGKDFSKAFGSGLNMLSFEDEVSGAAYVSDLITDPMNLVEMQSDARRDISELDEALYRIKNTGEVSKSDEQLYLEMHERYGSDAPVAITMEGFSFLKAGALAALATLIYLAVQRLVNWISGVIRVASNKDGLSGKSDKASATMKANDGLKTNTSKREQTVSKTEANDAVREAVGKKGDVGGEQPPVTTDDKLRALNEMITNVRKELVNSPEFDALQRNSTSVVHGYLSSGELDGIIRTIRRARPVRIAYLNDQCNAIASALDDQKRQNHGEVSSKVLGLATAMEQGQRAYNELFDTNQVFFYAGKKYPAYLNTNAFPELVSAVFDKATPVYPDETFMANLGTVVKDDSRALYASVSDSLSVTALKRFKELETMLRSLRDVAKTVNNLPVDYSELIGEYLEKVQAQVIEISAWYAFEERLRDTVSRFIDSVNDYASKEHKLLEDGYTKLGFKDAM